MNMYIHNPAANAAKSANALILDTAIVTAVFYANPIAACFAASFPRLPRARPKALYYPLVPCVPLPPGPAAPAEPP